MRKHVWTVGRWRVMWRIGRYQTGIERSPGRLTVGVPFLFVNAVRRTAR